MCTACGPFGPWGPGRFSTRFPRIPEGSPQHRSPRACRRHERTRQLPPHGRADPAPCSFPPAALRREVPSAEHRKAQQGQSGSGPGDPGVGSRAFDAALESRAAIAIKGAPDQHAEGATVLRDEDGCTARSRDAPAIHHHGTSGSRAAPVTFYLPGWQSQTHWSGTVRRIGFFWRSRPSDTSRYPLTCVFVACRNLHSGNSAGHRHEGSTPSRTCSLTPYRLDRQAGLVPIDESKAAGPPCHSQRRRRSPP
jgi:hypothetical protein